MGTKFDAYLKRKNEILGEIANGWLATFEYNNSRPLGTPSLSNFGPCCSTTVIALLLLPRPTLVSIGQEALFRAWSAPTRFCPRGSPF